LVQPGRYPIKARLLLAGQQPHIETSSLVIHLPGKITHSAILAVLRHALFEQYGYRLGQPSGTVLQPYAYDVRAWRKMGSRCTSSPSILLRRTAIFCQRTAICVQALWVEAVKA
jgi:hypothetical protein